MPPLAIVLGSGLGAFADEAHDATAVSYLDIPGFPVPSVEGHAGRLVVGKSRANGWPCFRVVATTTSAAMRTRCGSRSMRSVSSAARRYCSPTPPEDSAEWRPPTLVAITDHINFSGANPLIGHLGADRFVPLTKAYDETLLAALREAARSAEVELNEGVYMWFSGPTFETPAEIRAARILGADLVGMSTVPEVILARRVGLRCAAVSVVTNYAAGLASGDPSHEETQAVAHEAADRFKRLLRSFIRSYRPPPA